MWDHDDRRELRETHRDIENERAWDDIIEMVIKLALALVALGAALYFGAGGIDWLIGTNLQDAVNDQIGDLLGGLGSAGLDHGVPDPPPPPQQ